MKYDNTIFYDGKECNALEVIKNLDLDHTIYYKKRKQGLSAQEAFSYCWDFKQRLSITQIAKKTNISTNTISKGFRKGLSLEEIKLSQQKKREKNLQTLEYLREVGLPLEYNTIV